MITILILLLWIAFGIWMGVWAARRRGLDTAKAIGYGLMLGPAAFFLFGADDTTHQKCPYCTEWIKAGAIVCKHCSRDLPSTKAPTDVSRRGTCRLCAGAVPVMARSCPHCQAPIRTDHRRPLRLATPPGAAHEPRVH